MPAYDLNDIARMANEVEHLSDRVRRELRVGNAAVLASADKHLTAALHDLRQFISAAARVEHL